MAEPPPPRTLRPAAATERVIGPSLSLGAADPDSLAEWLRARRHSPSHARRILRAWWRSMGEPDWDGLRLGAPLHAELGRELAPPATRVVGRVESRDGTVKLLVQLRRGGRVEAVMMPSYREGEAWCCLSSQVGCAMGCDFCASTLAGFERNLEVDEIVEQWLHVGRVARAQNRSLRRLVFMGIGEPMLNLDNVSTAIDRIAGPDLGNLGWRRITVSTVGIIKGIERLAAAEHPVYLALSLHAPDDETRARIVPTAKRFAVADILAAARAYQERCDRIVTIEYCLLAGINDADAHARALADRLIDFRAHVNLIPYNPSGVGLSGTTYARPERERVDRFMAILRERGVVTHVRDARGDDVSAACGQLRLTLAG